MLIQAMLQSNYERSVTLVNTMAYAPFQITERQWTELFEKNGDRISQDSLEKLLNALCNCNAASEITVSNLSRALHGLCGSDKVGDFSSSTHLHTRARNISPLEGINEEFDVNRTRNVLSSAASLKGGNAPETDDTVNIYSVNQCGMAEEDDTATKMVSKSSACIHNNSRLSNLCILVQDIADDEESSDEYSDYLGDELATLISDGHSPDIDEAELEEQVSDSQKSKLPSANEILEAWKESREKDGIFFPFEP